MNNYDPNQEDSQDNDVVDSLEGLVQAVINAIFFPEDDEDSITIDITDPGIEDDEE